MMAVGAGVVSAWGCENEFALPVAGRGGASGSAGQALAATVRAGPWSRRFGRARG